MGQLQQRLEADLKTALLSGDRQTTSTLRMIKSVIQNEEINKNKRDSGLDDNEILGCLQREQKKRAEAIEMYEANGAFDRANAERAEQAIIKNYLPEQLSHEELNAMVDEVIRETGDSMQQMGVIMKEMQTKVKGRASGAEIAKIVRSKLAV